MSYYLNQGYLKEYVNRSSYKLREDYLGADSRYRKNHRNNDEDYFEVTKQKREKISEKKFYNDPIVSSLRRDELIFSKHNNSINKSTLLSNQMSNKNYLDLNTRLFEHQTKSTLSSHLSQSSLLYPYTYTEYSLMKEKVEEKRKAEDKWIENEIQRIRNENMLFYSKHPSQIKESYIPTLKIEQKMKNKQPLNELKESKFHNHPLAKTEASHQNYAEIHDLQPERKERNYYNIKKELYQSQKEIEKRDENTFIYDDLKESNSDYEEEIIKQNEKEEPKIDIEELYDSRLQKLELEHLKESPKKEKPEKALEYEDLSDIDESSIKKISKRCKTNKSNTYSKLIVFNSQENLEEQESSSYKSETFLKNEEHLENFNTQPEDMELYKQELQSYPIFSPLKNHKHLPQSTNQPETFNTDTKKSTKHYRALEEKKENEFKTHQYPKSIIVDELEKKKILSKSYDHHTFIERKAFYEHKIHEENIMMEKERMRNPEVQFARSQVYQSNQSSESVANNLRVDLEILKQQLEDKNKKVVDLEIELLELKSSIMLKSFEKKTNEISTETEIEPEKKSIEPLILEDMESQTVPIQKNLEFTHEAICFKIEPFTEFTNKDKELEKERNLRKKIQEKLQVQEEAMTNFLEDIEIYQTKNKELETESNFCNHKKITAQKYDNHKHKKLLIFEFFSNSLDQSELFLFNVI